VLPPASSTRTQLCVLSALSAVCTQLANQVLAHTSRAFAVYIHDALSGAKLQKTLLHCMLVVVHQHEWLPVPADVNR
jgi:hypothetical protein